jgi:hypothetical protein
MHSVGKGKLGVLPIAVGAEYEKNSDESLRNRVAAAVRALFPNPLVEVSGSPWVDVSISKLKDMRLVHLVNSSGDHKGAGIMEKIDPVGPLRVTIRCDEVPSAITLQPAGKRCEFASTKDGKVIVDVDSVKIYDILVIK